MKPETFMNNSGEAIAQAMNFYKIPLENVLVIFDDISLEPGHIRIRRKGSAGGHNGIKSIIALCGGEDFPRIKLGVGKKPRPDYDLADWVLGKFTPEQRQAFDSRLEDVCAAAELIAAGDISQAMNLYNK
jgi:PTH1 family peptidyl-tRNA hydrolase